MYDKTKNEGHRLGQNQRTGCPPICRSYRWLCNLLADLKARVRAAQLQAVLSVNRALIQLYWDIGKIIAEAQKTRGYGKQVVEQLAKDLQREFPGTAGFSPQNVWYMRSFYLAWNKELQKTQQPVGESTPGILPQLVGELTGSNLPQSVAEIPWGYKQKICAQADDLFPKYFEAFDALITELDPLIEALGFVWMHSV